MNDKDKLRVAEYTKEFINYVLEITINYPHKFYDLKNRLIDTSYDMLELIYFANTLEDRIVYQKQVLSKIAMLDFYLKQSYERKTINDKKLKAGTKLLITIRKITYRWMDVNASKL